jgi:hypothetical protein
MDDDTQAPSAARWQFERRPGPPKGSAPKSAARSRALDLKQARASLVSAIEELDKLPGDIAAHRIADALSEAYHHANLGVRFLRFLRWGDADGDGEDDA